MPSAAGHELADFIEGLDAAACADGGAIEAGCGAREIELFIEWPSCQQRIYEGGVKNVACAGGVDSVDAEGRCVVEGRAVPGNATAAAERGAGEAKTEATRKLK